jgi:hypothetical protein
MLKCYTATENQQRTADEVLGDLAARRRSTHSTNRTNGCLNLAFLSE